MVFSFSKLLLAFAVAFVVGIVLTGLLGPFIIDMKATIAVTLGRFFIDWGWPLAIVAGIFYYFGGPGWPNRTP